MRARILVVEDERIVALDVQRRLEAMGYEVLALVSSGEKAIQIAVEMQPDLILMDIKLKGAMDGIEAVRRILSARTVPIIYLTAFGDKRTLDQAEASSPIGILLKPFAEEELRTLVTVALSEAAGKGQGSEPP